MKVINGKITPEAKAEMVKKSGGWNTFEEPFFDMIANFHSQEKWSDKDKDFFKVMLNDGLGPVLAVVLSEHPEFIRLTEGKKQNPPSVTLAEVQKSVKQSKF